jgi:hypothetical protein
MDPNETVWEGMDFICLAQGMNRGHALVNMLMHLQFS